MKHCWGIYISKIYSILVFGFSATCSLSRPHYVVRWCRMRPSFSHSSDTTHIALSLTGSGISCSSIYIRAQIQKSQHRSMCRCSTQESRSLISDPNSWSYDPNMHFFFFFFFQALNTVHKGPVWPQYTVGTMFFMSREVKMSEPSCGTRFIGRNETLDLIRSHICVKTFT